MTIENNKITKATENELYAYWLSRGFDDIMSFTDYLRRCKAAGTEIVKTDERTT